MTAAGPPPADLARRLAAAAFIAAEEEAADLWEAAGRDPAAAERLLARRLTGEPLAWITGFHDFCGVRLRIAPGVYVPRPQSEPLARRATALLPPRGTAIDLCTGSGAIAAVLRAAHPGARVLATDADERAVACARANRIEALHGDLFAPLPAVRADLVTAVAPYVPTPDLPLLQRDTLAFETRQHYDGGPDGLAVLRRVIEQAPRFLAPGGTLLAEVGDGQPELLEGGPLRITAVLRDEDGDVRGVELQSS